MKRRNNFVVILLMLISMIAVISFAQNANGAAYFTYFKPVFSAGTPSSLQIEGAGCANAQCTAINNNRIELYNGDKFRTCWNNYLSNKNYNQLLTCVKNAKLTGDVVDLSKIHTIVTKDTTTNPFGSITEFFASGDSYIPDYYRIQGYICSYDFCVNPNTVNMEFVKKANAEAEIQKLNILNTNNSNKPIQISVPVKIDNTVCSALRKITNYYWFKPLPGYSDFSTNTQISLTIKNPSTGKIYKTDTVVIPIEASTCAGLSEFKWTPPENLENTKVLFKVETKVIDNEVSSTIPDYATDEETIYPTDLTDSCWVRAYNFTLSNIDSTQLTTSVAQISEGESLYLIFKSEAYKNNDLEPISYNAKVYFNNELVDTEDVSTSGFTTHTLDLSDKIKNLPAGSYTVKLVLTPTDNNCINSHEVIETQNLQILKRAKYTVKFYVKDKTQNSIQNAKIELKLLKSDDYYQNTPTFDVTQYSNVNGESDFLNVYPGDYDYIVQKSGYTTVNKNIHIGSNTNIYITLEKQDSKPVISLPSEFTTYYKKPIKINLRNYIYDYNDNFNSLKITATSSNNGINIERVGDYLEIYDLENKPMTANLVISVKDPEGSVVSGSTNLVYKIGEGPKITTFIASPNQGQIPLNVNFNIKVTEETDSNLICSLNFGDGTSKTLNNCYNINVRHTYYKTGTYDAELKVVNRDKQSDERTLKIFAYNHTHVYDPIPKINFTMNYSSKTVPTNLTFKWNAVSLVNNKLTCYLITPNETYNVKCDNGIKVIKNFNLTGLSVFELKAVDNESNENYKKIMYYFLRNNSAPELLSFNVSPTKGYAPLKVNINAKIKSDNYQDLSCDIFYGDGKFELFLSDCKNFNRTHIYDKPGNYTITFDYYNIDQVENPIMINRTIEVLSNSTTNSTNNTNNTKSKTPIIEYFKYTKSSMFTPSNVTLKWKVISPVGNDMQCYLALPKSAFQVNCIGNITLKNYNITGNSKFVLTALDNESNSATRAISLYLYSKENFKSELYINKNLVPGKVKFNISLSKISKDYNLELTPELICNGNTLTYDGNLAYYNKEYKNGETYYNYEMDTNKFNLNIPLNENCKFIAKLKIYNYYDKSYVNLEKDVIFNYPKYQPVMQSIRGNDVDILNYLTTATTTLNKGFNTISLRINNNENYYKTISITFSSNSLNLFDNENVNLNPKGSKVVTVPLYISKDLKPGMYPLRISVNDGHIKQTRYSYVKIN